MVIFTRVTYLTIDSRRTSSRIVPKPNLTKFSFCLLIHWRHTFYPHCYFSRMDMILEVHALICNWCNEILPQGPQEIFHYNVRLPVLVHGGKTTDLIHFRLWHPSGNTKWRYSKLRHHIFFRSKFNRWWIEKWIDISYWGCRYFLNIEAFCDCLLILNDEWFVFSSRKSILTIFIFLLFLVGCKPRAQQCKDQSSCWWR